MKTKTNKDDLDVTFELCKEKCTDAGEDGCAGLYLFETQAGAPKCNGLTVSTVTESLYIYIYIYIYI